MKKKSAFGKGFIYNLVLFAKHYERFKAYMEENDKMALVNPEFWKKGAEGTWFNGAGDHFSEFEIPKQFRKTKIGKIAKELQNEAMERRVVKTTIEEFAAFFGKLENLCLLIDEELGVKTIEAKWN